MDITNEIDGVDTPELHKLPKTVTPTSRAKRGPTNRVEPGEKVEVYKVEFDRLLSENEALKESNAKLTQIVRRNNELEEENGELMAQKQCLTQELGQVSNTADDDMDAWLDSRREKIPELEQHRLARQGHGLDGLDCKNCKCSVHEAVTEKQSLTEEQMASSSTLGPGSSRKTDEAGVSKSRKLEEDRHDLFAHLFSYFLVLLFALNVLFICLYSDQAFEFMEDIATITTTKFQEAKQYFSNILQ